MYREVGLMQVVEILRRWQAGQSTRAIAKATGLARNTIGKYLAEAKQLGLGPQGPAATDAQLLALAQLSQTAPPARAAPGPPSWRRTASRSPAGSPRIISS